LFTVKGEKT
jgi:hypothetical protein